MFLPSIRISPSMGGMAPRMVRNSVVLPTPLGPSRHRFSPAATVRSTLLSTVAPAVAALQIAQLEDHVQALLVRAMSTMKNGAPMRAVRMPSGISSGPASRARSSTSSRYTPPITAETGSSLP